MPTRPEFDPLSVPCTYCKAAVGDPCNTVRRKGPHLVRQDRAARKMHRELAAAQTD